MHIDHEKFLELLVDASGIEKEKVEKQLNELQEEIKQAIADGEAYEIEGFGILSGLGNNTLFIPSKELEIEINFKYVGMEPIEIEGEVIEPKEEYVDPFEELQSVDSSEEGNRFTDLIEESEEEEKGKDDPLIFGVSLDNAETEEEAPGPDKWGIDAHKEDTGVDKLFSSLMGDQGESVTGDKIEPETESSEPEESEFKLEVPEEESGSSLDDELAQLMSDDSTGNEAAENDESIESVFESDFEDPFLEDENEEAPEEESEETEAEPEPEPESDEEPEAISEPEPEPEVEPEPESEPKVEEESEAEAEEPTTSAVEEEEDDDFDDPFASIDDDDEEEDLDLSGLEEKEVIPVITNISSDLEKKEPEAVKEKKPKKAKSSGSQSASVWLWMILILFVLVGATVGLAYFSVINIPGITPQVATSQPIQQPVQVTPPAETPQTGEETRSPDQTSEEQTPPPVTTQQEQESVAEVPIQTNAAVPVDQSIYGLMGVTSTVANDGYTIVIYSLSVEENALAKQRELSANGYRVLVTPINSSQYGTLWRVSLGQFETLVDAAIAGENLEGAFKDNYFIKKITN